MHGKLNHIAPDFVLFFEQLVDGMYRIPEVKFYIQQCQTPYGFQFERLTRVIKAFGKQLHNAHYVTFY